MEFTAFKTDLEQPLLQHPACIDNLPPQSLTIKGIKWLEANSGEEDLSFIGEHLVSISGENWSEVTDVFNTSTGDFWRIPAPDAEKRVVKCFMDEHAYYIVVEKGFQAISRNLIKLDKNTKETLWTCGLSMVGGRTFYAQDNNFIYYTDQKNVFCFSKAKGKKVGAFKYIDTENALKKKIIAPESSHLFLYHDQGVVISGYQKKSYNYIVRYVRFATTPSPVWELDLGKLAFAAASMILNNQLYLLMNSGNVIVVDMKDGKILSTIEAPKEFLPSGLRNASPFTYENQQLSVVAKGEIEHKYQGEYKTILIYDITSNSCKAFDATTLLGTEMNIFHETEIIKNNIIYSSGKNHLKAVRVDTQEEIASLTLENYGFIERFIIVGELIYMIQQIRSHDIHQHHSVLYQIG